MDDSDNEDIGRDLSKIIRNAETNGYREGLMDETEVLLQQRFDSGYEMGVKLGLVSGFYNGLLKSITQDKQSYLSEDLIKTAKSAIESTEKKDVLEKNCHMCIHSEFYTKPFDEIYKEQQTAIYKYISDAHEHNSSIINELKIDVNPITSKSALQ